MATRPDEEAATGAPRPVDPPVHLLALGALSAAAGVALLTRSGLGVAVLGYLLASIVTIVLIGSFRRTDLRRRQHPHYRPRPSLTRVAAVIVILGVLAAAAHTWTIATELAR
ncbi:MAG: hypothetical protein ACKOBG_10530 [Actinomycetota bacterium]